MNSSKRHAKIIPKYIISITGEAGYKTLLLTVYNLLIKRRVCISRP